MLQQGSEYWAAKQTLTKEPMIFDLRYCSGVTRLMRVLFDYKAYDIQDVINVDERNRRMYIVTTAYDIDYAKFIYSNLAGVDDGSCTGKAVITWDTDFYSDSQVFYKKGSDDDYTATPDSAADTDPRVLSHTVTTPSLDLDATYTFKVRGYNGGGYTPGYSDTIALGPVISDIECTESGDTTATIEFSTDVLGTSLVKYGTSESPGDWDDASTETETYQTSHSVELTGLLDNTTYYYKPWSRSEGGWYGQAADINTFDTTQADIEFSAFYANKMFGYIQLGWTTNIATKRKIQWRVKDTSNEWTINGFTSVYVLTGTVPTTIPDTPSKEYEFYAYSITEGGTLEWSAMRYLTVDFEGDVTIQIYGEG